MKLTPSHADSSDLSERTTGTVTLTVAYLGGHYAGWQRQPNATTVQQTLEEALLQFSGRNVVTVGAGRTDAGVHADGQVVHLQVRSGPEDGLSMSETRRSLLDLPSRAWVLGTNRHLPGDIRVVAAGVQSPEFHAQRDAVLKRYRYRLANSPVIRPLDRIVRAPLPPRAQIGLFAEALARFVGRHDFSAFQKSGGAPADPVRSVQTCRLERRAATAGEELDVVIEARGFLRGMVRAMVGTALEVCTGKRTLASLETLLEGRPRSEAGPAASANGLTLEKVWYRRLPERRFPESPGAWACAVRRDEAAESA